MMKRVNLNSAFKAIECQELFRFFVIVKEDMLYRMNDDKFQENIISHLDWKLKTSQLLFPIFQSDQEARIEVSNTIVNEMILRKQYKYHLEVILENLNMNSSQLQELCKIIKQTAENYSMGDSFNRDIEIKCMKLKWKLGIEKSPFRRLGGLDGITALLKKFHEVCQDDEKIIKYFTQYPDEEIHFQYQPKPQKSEIYDISLSHGINLLEYILLNLFSEYDCYGTEDIKGGIQAFNIDKTVAIQWKIALDKTCHQLKLPQDLQEIIVNEFSKEILQLYSKEERKLYEYLWFGE